MISCTAHKDSLEKETVRLDMLIDTCGVWTVFVHELENTCDHAALYIMTQWLLHIAVMYGDKSEPLNRKLLMDDKWRRESEFNQMERAPSYLRLHSRDIILRNLLDVRFPDWHPYHQYWARKRYDGNIPLEYFSEKVVKITVLVHTHGYSSVFIAEEARRALMRGDVLTEFAAELPISTAKWEEISLEYCKSSRTTLEFMKRHQLPVVSEIFDTNFMLLKKMCHV